MTSMSVETKNIHDTECPNHEERLPKVNELVCSYDFIEQTNRKTT